VLGCRDVAHTARPMSRGLSGRTDRVRFERHADDADSRPGAGPRPRAGTNTGAGADDRGDPGHRVEHRRGSPHRRARHGDRRAQQRHVRADECERQLPVRDAVDHEHELQRHRDRLSRGAGGDVRERDQFAELRAGGAAKQIAAGENATAGTPNPQTDDDDDDLSGGALAVLLAASAGAIIAIILAANNDDEFQFAGNPVVVSPAR